MARYKKGGYKAPAPEEIEVEGLGSFVVKPLPNSEQDEIRQKTQKKDNESDQEYAGRLGYAFMAASLLAPQMTAKELETELDQWTNRQSSEFVQKVQVAGHVIDKEDLDEVSRRFRSQDD